MKRFFLLLLLIKPALAIADSQQMVTEVIPLGYRSVNEIVPVARPLVTPGGSVSGLQGQLVVTATPRNMAKVRKMLAALDKAPARLLISVRQGDSRIARRDSASVQGHIGNIGISRDGIHIGVPGEHQGEYQIADEEVLSLQANLEKRDAETTITQQLQVLEGREAYITTGQEIPVPNRGSAIGPAGVYRYDNTEFYPAVTGFYAIPRLQGDEVFVEINSVSRRADNLKINGRYPHQNRQPVTVSNAETSVAGRLGEWILIGNADQSGSINKKGLASVSGQQMENTSEIYLRVEKIRNGY